MSGEQRANVIVVGAGLAGLTAAEQLAGRGLDVRVVEARGRVGGRTYSKVMAGQAVDMGAEHIGANHRRMRALCERLGIALEPSGMLTAKARWQIAGRDKVGNVPPVPLSELARSGKVLARLGRLARQLPMDAPWEAPAGRILDRISLAEWLDAARVEGAAREVHDTLWQDGFSVEPERISMLHMLWAAPRAGGVLAAIRDTVGYHVDGGTQSVANALAERLGPRLELGKPVIRVEQDDDEVCVTTEDGETRRADQAVVCAPLPALPSIDFSPELPEELARAHAEISFGRATAIIVGSPAAKHPGYLTVTGNKAFGFAWRRGPTAKAKVLDVRGRAIEDVASEVARATQIPDEERQTEHVVWPAEPFTGGTYVNFQPGQLTRFGPHLRRAHGRVHFAAAERSSFSTFMEGGVEAGARAAADVLSRLRRPAGASKREEVSA
jgi:monoamine oxidase